MNVRCLFVIWSLLAIADGLAPTSAAAEERPSHQWLGIGLHLGFGYQHESDKVNNSFGTMMGAYILLYVSERTAWGFEYSRQPEIQHESGKAHPINYYMIILQYHGKRRGGFTRFGVGYYNDFSKYFNDQGPALMFNWGYALPISEKLILTPMITLRGYKFLENGGGSYIGIQFALTGLPF